VSAERKIVASALEDSVGEIFYVQRLPALRTIDRFRLRIWLAGKRQVLGQCGKYTGLSRSVVDWCEFEELGIAYGTVDGVLVLSVISLPVVIGL
jgi:hypothetical protein